MKILNTVIMILLIFSSSFAGPGNIATALQKLLGISDKFWTRRSPDKSVERWLENNSSHERNLALVIEDFKISDTPGEAMDEILSVVVTTNQLEALDLTAHKRFIEKFRGELDDKEILEAFEDVFRGTNRNSPTYDNYITLMFDHWWRDEKVRPFIFNMITKKDLSNPDYLLRWWDEAKARGAELKLKEYTREFMANLDAEIFDPFGEVLMKTVMDSDSFARQWKELTKPATTTWR